MSVLCPVPDPGSGVALRLSDYLTCQAGALGENGFHLLMGGPLGMGMLSGVVTLFIAFIGYRLILGEMPEARDGIGWTVRLGFVLALATSWPAFQVLVFRVAVDGPTEIATVLLPATGVSPEGLDWRIQQAYDTIRIGPTSPLSWTPVPAAGSVSALPPPVPMQTPMPSTASIFVLSTLGIIAALRIAAGILLAVGPLAIMALLFDATLGIFVGWVRALTGLALATAAAIIVTAVDLGIVESELAYLETLRATGFAPAVDRQALSTIVLVFALIMLVTTFAAMRMTNAFRLSRPRPFRAYRFDRREDASSRPAVSLLASTREPVPPRAEPIAQSRVAGVAEALAAAVRRDRAYSIETSALSGSPRHDFIEAAVTPTGPVGLGTLGRRGVGRRTRTAARRDLLR